MNINFKYNIENIDWKELKKLYEKTYFDSKEESKLKTAFENSMFKCFIYDDKKLVGAGRALADGVFCSYLCDIAVFPEYQGLGLGKKILEYLMAQSKDYDKMILYASVEKEGFYKKFGFKTMNTAMAVFKNEEEKLKKGIIKE